jgi:hypothetical protein
MVAVEPIEQGIPCAPFEDDPYVYEPLEAAPDAGVRRMAECSVNLPAGVLGVGSSERGEHVSIKGRRHHAEGVAEVHFLGKYSARLATIAFHQQEKLPSR